MNKNLRIMERDKKVMREIDRWRVCLGRHIRELAGFTGERACDRRLRKLIEAGYIERKHILYGVPAI
jgi:DNA-binding Lrp family transcriptional regulator